MSGTLSSPDENNLAVLTEQLNQINQALEPAAENPSILTEDFVKNIITLNQEEVAENTEVPPNAAEELIEEVAEEAKPENRLPLRENFYTLFLKMPKIPSLVH